MAKDREFYQGIGVVLGWLARRGEDSLVEYAMNDNGLSLKDLKAAGVDAFDLDPITNCLFTRYDRQGMRMVNGHPNGDPMNDPPGLR